MTYLDSTFNYQVEIPEWLNLKETGNHYVFGGTLPAINGIENAIVIKVFDKSKFPTLLGFKKFVIEDVELGASPKWSSSHKLLAKEELGEYKSIGERYKVSLLLNNLRYNCEYILVETKSAYLWIDFTSTKETFDRNISKFEEFMSSFQVTNF